MNVSNLRTNPSNSTLKPTNVIAIFGTQPETGVTSLTLALAQRLAECNVSVGVLGLNVFNPGDWCISKYEGLYLDELKSYLSNRIFSEEQLKAAMALIKNVRYLSGNRDIKKRIYYTNEDIAYLIQLAQNAYDIVFIDAGTQFDNALTIQALLCSDLRFVITTQSMRAYSYWQNTVEQILNPLGFDSKSFLMVVNKYQDNLNLPKAKFLQNMYHTSILEVIPDLGELGLIAEHEKKLLTEFDVKHYKASLNSLVNNIFELYGIIPRTNEHPVNKGIIRKLISMI